MIRFFRAFLWLRWRLFVNSLRGSNDMAARLARWGQAIVGVAIPMLFIPVALGLGVLALFAGKFLGTVHTDPSVVTLPARIMLGVITGVVIFAPLIRSVHGSATGRSRFLLLPIPRSALHLAETASSLSDPWLAVMVVPLLLLPLGWLVWGEAGGALLALAGGLVMLAALTTISALAAFLAHLLLRDRRRAEMIALVILTLVTVLSFVPILMDPEDWGGDQTKDELAQAEREFKEKFQTGLRFLRPFTWVLPSELYGRVVQQAHAGRPGAALLPLGLMVAVTAGLFQASSRAHRRLLDTPETGAVRGSGGELELRVRRLPGLGPAPSAVAWVTARMAMRTVKGKLAVFTTPLGVGFLAFLLSRQWSGVEIAGLHVGAAAVGSLLAMALPLLSWQPVLLNLYAVDRAGLTLQFLGPISDHDLVRGKVAGGALLTALASAPSLLAVALITREGPLVLWVAVILGFVATYLVLGPAFAMLSAIFPKAADLSSLGTQGNASQLAGLLATVLIPAILSPVVILLFAGQFLFGNLYAGLGLLAGWLMLAAALSYFLTHLAATLLGRRRENISLIAQGR
jgi:hypothetical protein